MTPPWGINWLRYHPNNAEDMAHIERMGYRSFTIYEWMWSDRDFVNALVSAAPKNAIFLNRDHPLSEQKDAEWISYPASKGRKHADEWAAKVQQGRVYTPLDRTYFLGINEPDSNQYQKQIDQYNLAFCSRMSEHGLRAAAYSFGVGHPSSVNLQPDTLPDWSHYKASAQAVIDGGHIAALHEYGAPDGYGWGFWCNRSRYCPYPFRVVLDECGIDYGVVNAGELYGWAKFMSPEEYVHWLDGFQYGMAERAATRTVDIIGYNIFAYDHGQGKDKDWHSFDIRPCRPLLEAQQWSVPAQPTPAQQHNAYMPHVATPQPAPTAEPVTPQPLPQSENWRRCIVFVLRWESGYVNDPNDPGGETNYGISKRSYPDLDIANLTRDEAIAIYRRDYWQRSGADALPWPLCLAHFDTAVNAGTRRAQHTLIESDGNFLRYMGLIIDWYTRIDNFEHFGKAWIRRRADLLVEASRA